jgi:LDH2 family malate/lactate/ureidoglycolate dehydrogenase
VVLDMAAASTSWGNVHQHARNGLSLPDGLALDAAGLRTRDPREAAVLLPASERTQAAAIVLQVLLSMLGDTALPDGAEGRLLLSLAIEPTRLGITAATATTDTISGAVRGNGTRMPGDRAWAHRSSALRNGIDMDDGDLARLIAAGYPDIPVPPELTHPDHITSGKETLP